MRCEVKDCIHNVNGYCEAESYITIQEDSSCDSVLISQSDTEEE